MSNVINPKKKFNHRWKSDPKFIKGFDYDSPEHVDVPDDLKWALPIFEATSSPAEVQRQKRLQEKVKNEYETEKRANRLKSRTLKVL